MIKVERERIWWWRWCVQ